MIPTLRSIAALYCLSLSLAFCQTFDGSQHKWRYDGPEIQEGVNELKTRGGYLPLVAGSQLTVDGRLVTITEVRQDGVVLLVEGTIKNLKRETIYAGTGLILLNESPDRQMKWFKAHPVTSEYHYGPGFNSHSVGSCQVTVVAPGKTGTFAAFWIIAADTIAREPVEDLVINPSFSDEQ